jgi:hypothetical protein
MNDSFSHFHEHKWIASCNLNVSNRMVSQYIFNDTLMLQYSNQFWFWCKEINYSHYNGYDFTKSNKSFYTWLKCFYKMFQQQNRQYLASEVSLLHKVLYPQGPMLCNLFFCFCSCLTTSYLWKELKEILKLKYYSEGWKQKISIAFNMVVLCDVDEVYN